jgi:hypothetical protein
MVVSMHPAIFQAHANYEQEGTELTLTSDLKRLLRAASTHAASVEANGSEGEGSRIKRALSVTIPQRTLQKLPGIDNRI